MSRCTVLRRNTREARRLPVCLSCRSCRTLTFGHSANVGNVRVHNAHHRFSLNQTLAWFLSFSSRTRSGIADSFHASVLPRMVEKFHATWVARAINGAKVSSAFTRRCTMLQQCVHTAHTALLEDLDNVCTAELSHGSLEHVPHVFRESWSSSPMMYALSPDLQMPLSSSDTCPAAIRSSLCTSDKVPEQDIFAPYSSHASNFKISHVVHRCTPY